MGWNGAVRWRAIAGPVLGAVLLAGGCGGDDRDDVVTDCAGGPAGGDPMSVAAAAQVEPGDCDGGFGVRGRAFPQLDDVLLLCDAVDGDPPRCVEPSVTVAAGPLAGITAGQLVDATLTHQDGVLAATSVSAVPTAAP